MIAIGLRYANDFLEFHLGIGEWTTGNITLKISEVFGAYRFEVINKGFPEASALGGNWVQEPLMFKEISIAFPKTHTLLWGSLLRAKPFGEWDGDSEYWNVVPESDKKQSSLLIPNSDKFHCLEGGTSVFWEAVVGQASPYSLEQTRITKVKSLLGIIDGYESAQYPLVKKASKLWSLSDTATNAPVRDLGWYMINYNFRFGSNLDTLGWHNFGNLYIELHSNYRYMPELYCLERYLKYGDEQALGMAFEMMKRKYMLGYFKTDKVPLAHRYASRSEKSNFRVGDSGNAYKQEKTWHVGFAMVAYLTQDPDLLDLRKKLEIHLLNQVNAQVWDGAWGDRKIGWYLMNLRAHYDLFGNEACSLKAKSFIDHVFAKVGTRTWFQNDGNGPTTTVKAWMTGKALVGILKWPEHAAPYMDKIKSIVHWYLDHGIVSDADPRVIYEVSQGYPGVAPIAYPTVFKSGANTAAFLWGLCEVIPHFPNEQRFKDVAKKQADLVFKHLGVEMQSPIPTDCTTIAPGAYGGAGLKEWLFLMMPARDKYLQLLESL